LSTTEAEYTVAADAAREAIWLDDLLKETGLREKVSPTLNQDNQSAIFLEQNHSLSQRTKHIDIKAHFIREKFQQGRIAIKYCPTQEMMADILTKPINKNAFIKHRTRIMNMKGNSTKSDAPEEECQGASTSTAATPLSRPTRRS
jgi:hypothetical protein